MHNVNKIDCEESDSNTDTPNNEKSASARSKLLSDRDDPAAINKTQEELILIKIRKIATEAPKAGRTLGEIADPLSKNRIILVVLPNRPGYRGTARIQHRQEKIPVGTVRIEIRYISATISRVEQNFINESSRAELLHRHQIPNAIDVPTSIK